MKLGSVVLFGIAGGYYGVAALITIFGGPSLMQLHGIIIGFCFNLLAWMMKYIEDMDSVGDCG